MLTAALAALPPPPEKVVFQNRKGDVTLDHRAHNARLVPCSSCHGPGVVEKIRGPGFEMQRAHMMCVGCHRTVAKGPILCRDCHGGRADSGEGATAAR